MSSTLQIKRRLTGSSGSPSVGVEGELALNFAGGVTKTPELYANGGAALGWLRVNPDTVVSVGSIALPSTGPAGSSSGIGAAWTAFATKPTTSIVISSYGGTAYVKTGAGGADGDWVALGAATSFASQVEVDAGTDTAKAINSAMLRGTSRAAPTGGAGPVAADADKLVRLTTSGTVDPALIPRLVSTDSVVVTQGVAINSFLTPAGLESRVAHTPNATPANDQNKLPALDATGKIPTGFLPVGGLVFSGTIDPTAAAYAAPTPAPTNGQFFSVSKAGAVSTAWKAYFADAGITNVALGDYMVWDATASKFHHIANAIDMSAYVPLAGTTAMTGNIVWGGAAANKNGTIIFDGKGGTVDAVTIDGGNF